MKVIDSPGIPSTSFNGIFPGTVFKVGGPAVYMKVAAPDKAVSLSTGALVDMRPNAQVHPQPDAVVYVRGR